MRLTNYLRDAFIRAAMNDVPKVDFDDQMQKLITEDVVARLPAKVRAIYADKTLRHYLNTKYAHNFGGVSVPCMSGESVDPSESARAAYSELNNKRKAQDETRTQLERKLKACAYACNTRDALVKMLPEFEKYMPASEEKSIRSLPVVANVVSDFVKAGWPKAATKQLKKAA